MTHYPKPCSGSFDGEACDRLIQPRRWPKADGIVIHSGKGMCGRCLAAVERGSTTRRVLIQPHQPCIECRTPMRVRHTKLEDFPDTAEHAGLGACSSCYQVGQRQKQRTTHLITDPHAPRVPKGWHNKTTKPAEREPQKSSGQHVYIGTPDTPPHIAAQARATVLRHGGDPMILAMLGLDT